MRYLPAVLVALALAAPVGAEPNRMFLDFNRDYNLHTIDDVSFAPYDTVTLILEFNEIPENFEFLLEYETSCDLNDDDPLDPTVSGGAYISWLGCDEEYFDQCEFRVHVCNNSCECLRDGFYFRIDPQAPLIPGSRYEMARFEIHRGSLGVDGVARFVERTWDYEDRIETNVVKVGQGLLPTLESSWGQIKAVFR